MKSWVLTGLECVLLIGSAGRERLPYPLQYAVENAAEEEIWAARRSAQSKVSPLLEGALVCLLEPEVQVQSVSFVAHRGAVSKLRALAGIRGTQASVAVQQPTTSESSGGGITLFCGTPTDAVDQLVASLPHTPAGRRPPASGSPDTAGVAMPGRAGQHAGLSWLLAQKRTGTGEIVVSTTPSYSTRQPMSDYAFAWIDLADDGRYLMHGSGDSLRAFPADRARLAAEISTRLTAAATSATAATS